MKLSLPKCYRLPFVLIILAFVLTMAVLWQMEIISIWISSDIYHFEFPFYIEKYLGYENGINVWVARDFWYLIQLIAVMLGIAGGYLLGER